MVENDWIRPTPDGEHDLMLLSNAEALAVARQLPEVKALAEACRWWLEKGRFLAGNAPAKMAGVERTEAALAPFEEATDGTSG